MKKNESPSDLIWPINVPPTNALVRADSWTLEQEKLLFQLVLTVGTCWVEIGKFCGVDESRAKNRYYSALRRIERAHMVSSNISSELLRSYIAKCTPREDDLLVLPLVNELRKMRSGSDTPAIVSSLPSNIPLLPLQTIDKKRIRRSTVLPSPAPPSKSPPIEQSYTRSGQIKTATLESITAFSSPPADIRPRQLSGPTSKNNAPMSHTILQGMPSTSTASSTVIPGGGGGGGAEPSTVAGSAGKRVQYEDPVVFSPYSKTTLTTIAPPLKFNDANFVSLVASAFSRVTGKTYNMQSIGSRGESTSSATFDFNIRADTGGQGDSVTPRSLIGRNPLSSHRSEVEDIFISPKVSTWIPPWASLVDSLESSRVKVPVKESIPRVSVKKTKAPKIISSEPVELPSIVLPSIAAGRSTLRTTRGQEQASVILNSKVARPGGPISSPVGTPRDIPTALHSPIVAPIRRPRALDAPSRTKSTSSKRTLDKTSTVLMDSEFAPERLRRVSQYGVREIDDVVQRAGLSRELTFLPTFSPAPPSYTELSPFNPDFRLRSTPVDIMSSSDQQLGHSGTASRSLLNTVFEAPKQRRMSSHIQTEPEMEISSSTSMSEEAISTLLGLGQKGGGRASPPFSPSTYLAIGSGPVTLEQCVFSPLQQTRPIQQQRHMVTPAGFPFRQGRTHDFSIQKSPLQASPWALTAFDSPAPPPPSHTDSRILSSPILPLPTPSSRQK